MTFYETSWEQMKARVYRHRIAKIDEAQSEEGYDIKPGWIERLFHDLCLENPQVEADVLDDNNRVFERWLGLNDLARFNRTVQKFLATGGKWEPAEVGIDRLKSCTSGEEGGRKCRWHVRVHGCWGCSKIVDVVASFAGKPDLGKHEDGIMSCGVCGCSLSEKVLLPIEVSDDGLEYPPHCWIQQERLTPRTPHAPDPVPTPSTAA